MLSAAVLEGRYVPTDSAAGTVGSTLLRISGCVFSVQQVD